jgi:hypothetical protein
MWTSVKTKYHGIHIVPDNDSTGHNLDRLCLCVPTKDWVPSDFESYGSWIFVHNAWDGREAREREDGGETYFADQAADTMSVWEEGGMVSWNESGMNSANAAQNKTILLFGSLTLNQRSSL